MDSLKYITSYLKKHIVLASKKSFSLVKKPKIELKFFFLNCFYGTSFTGRLVHIFLYFGYISLVTFFISHGVAHCGEETSISQEKFIANGLKIVKDFQQDNEAILELFTLIYQSLPGKASINLEEIGLFKLKTKCEAFSSFFPLNKLSDYHSVLPNKFDPNASPIATLFMHAVKNPNRQTVFVAGTYTNFAYMTMLNVFADPKANLAIKAQAWNQMIIFLPAAFEFQIKTYNQILEIIGYPYRVEDFYPGSAYARCSEMKGEYLGHRYMRSYYDPYSSEYPLTTIYSMISQQENLVKQFFYQEMTEKYITYDIFWKDHQKPEIPVEPFRKPIANNETPVGTLRKSLSIDETPQNPSKIETPSSNQVNKVDDSSSEIRKKLMKAEYKSIRDELARTQAFNDNMRKGLILGGCCVLGAVIGVSIGYIKYKNGL